MITLRFDMRAPASGAPKSELYAAAIEMCSWVETRGAVSVVLSEHHATEDNHLPAPLILGSAIKGRMLLRVYREPAASMIFAGPLAHTESIQLTKQ